MGRRNKSVGRGEAREGEGEGEGGGRKELGNLMIL